MDLGARNLFKQAFPAKGQMADSSAIARQQEVTAGLEKQKIAQAESAEKLKGLGNAAMKGAASFALVPPALLYFSRSLVDSQQELRQFSTKAAHAYSVLEGGRFQRTASRASATEDTNKQLVKHLDSLERTLAPHMDTLTNVLNILATAGLLMLEKIVLAAEYMVPALKVWSDAQRDSKRIDGMLKATEAVRALDGLAERGKEAGKPRFPKEGG